MPLLWKKPKTTRISRMVADLHSPKRGGSLVVETGFPTSIIDLFVKNRDRLRKPSIKKRKNKNKNDHDIDDGEDSANRIDDQAPVESEDVEIPSGIVLDSDDSNRSGENTARVGVEILAAVVGVLAIAFLALSTKKLAVVVTLSAFALLLVELVSIRINRRQKSGGDPESESDEDEDEDEFIATRSAAIRFADEGVSSSKSQDQVSGLLEKSKSKSKRAKIRRKIIKNFVPKKLRAANKQRKKAKLEANLVEEESPEILPGEEEHESVEMSAEDDEGEEDAEQDQEFWTLLTILGAALLGLCWGRVFSLVLTIAWCVGIKLIAFIRRLWEAFRKVSTE